MEGCSRRAPQDASRRPRVLLACTRSAQPFLARALAGSADCTAVYSFDDALLALDDRPDVVVCTLRFDDSRMLELAREVSRRGDVALVCCRIGESDLPAPSIAAAGKAAEYLGALPFIDFPALSRERGIDAALACLRAEVLAAA